MPSLRSYSTRRRHIHAEINVTPLTDVALVLLVIFMLTATFLGVEGGVDIDLPGATSATPRQDVGAVLVVVAKDGQVRIDSQEIPRDKLVQAFREKAAVGGRKQVVIRGDRAASYKAVFEVMDAARVAGLSEISLATQQAPPPRTESGTR
jgi:biopolymer transport protein ExbD